MATFLHAGDIGDMIYALVPIQALAGGILYLDLTHHKAPICRTTERTYHMLYDLIKYQPYIEDFRIWNGEHIDYYMDQWRNDPDILNHNIADAHLRVFNLPYSFRDAAWLTVPETITVPDKPYIIARSARHRVTSAPYLPYCKDGVFVGLDSEYQDFVRDVAPVERFDLRNSFMRFAQLIAGSELFIGNQSSGFALAEGLKVNVLQETHWGVPNCIFRRPNARYWPHV